MFRSKYLFEIHTHNNHSYTGVYHKIACICEHQIMLCVCVCVCVWVCVCTFPAHDVVAIFLHAKHSGL
jgi:hypothetical protein